jgi:hypothetical protein
MPVLIKPTSSRCNLNCSYCFYLSKAELYPWAGSKRSRQAPPGRWALSSPGGAMPARQRSATTPLSLVAVRDDARKRGVGRNGPCPCGSGAKFKRCCGA